MPAILSRISNLFTNYISRDLDKTKILFYKFFFRYVVVKPAFVNAAIVLFYFDVYFFSWNSSFNE